MTYTIDVSNVGTAPTGGSFTVNEHPGAGLTPVSLSGDGYVCDLASLTCTSNSATPLAPGAHAPITFVAHVNDEVPAVIENDVTVGGGGDGNPPTTSRPTAGTRPDRRSLVDKTVDKTACRRSAGTSPSRSSVHNAGASRRRTIVVTDPVPAGLSIITLGSGCQSTAQLVTCQLDSLAAGADQTFTFTAQATPSAAGTTQTNTATVAAATRTR